MLVVSPMLGLFSEACGPQRDEFCEHHEAILAVAVIHFVFRSIRQTADAQRIKSPRFLPAEQAFSSND
jgi:hypothetical protein